MAAEEYVSLCLLGPLQLSPWPEDAPELVRKSRGLLGYLGGVTTPQARHTLAELFFHQAKDPSAALRWHLTRLRKALGAHHLYTPSGFVSLHDVHRDVDLFAPAARELIQCADDMPDPSAVSHQIDVIQQHYRGAFLEGLEMLDCPDFVLWLLGKRAYFARLYADSLRAGISALRRLSMLMEALPLARALVATEEATVAEHCALIQLYTDTGQLTAAQQQYEHSLILLQEMVGEAPTAEERQQLRAALDASASGTHRHAFQISQSPKAELTPRTSLGAAMGGDGFPFVGRYEALKQLDEALEAARRGQGRCVLIGGIAGSGKSRLVQHFLSLVDVPGWSGSCYLSSQRHAYYPWQGLFTELVQAMGLSDEPALAPFRKYLRLLLPEWEMDSTGDDVPQAHTQVLYRAVQIMLGCATAAGPVVLVIDDLHWSDEESLGLLQELMRWVRGQPIVLIGVYRTEEVDGLPSLVSCLRWHRRFGGGDVTLSGLTEEDAAALIEQYWTKLPDDRHGAASQRLFRETDGHPLALCTLLEELREQEELPSVLPLPSQLQDLVEVKWERLSDHSASLLEPLSVLTHPFDWWLIQRLLNAPQEQQLEAVEEGCSVGLLKESGGMPPQYRWTHELMRQGAIQRLSGLRQQIYHEQAAVALEQVGTSPETLMFHWRCAGHIPHQAQWTAKAGLAAAARGEPLLAATFLEQALALTPDAPDRDLWQLKLGESQLKSGQWVEAEASLVALFARSSEQSYQLALLIGRVLQDKGEPAQALVWFHRAQTLQGEPDGEFSCELWAFIGRAHLNLARYDQARRALEQAMVYVGPQTRAYTMCSIWESFGLIAKQQGDLVEAAQYFQSIRSYVETLDDPLVSARALNNVGNYLATSGDYDGAHETFLQMQRGADDLGLPFLQARACSGLGLVAFYRGDVERIFRYYHDAIPLYRELDAMIGVWISVHNIGETYTRLGAYHEAELCFRWNADFALARDDRRRVLVAMGRLAIAYGAQSLGFALATDVLEQVIGGCELLSLPHELCVFSCEAAEIYLRFGEGDAAATHLATAQRLAAQIDDNEIKLVRVRCLAMEAQLHRGDGTDELVQRLCDALPTSPSRALTGLLFEQLARLWAALGQELESQRYRREALAAYAEAYEQTPEHWVRLRYEEWGGEALEAPPPSWPAAPAFLQEEAPARDALMARFGEWSTTLTGQP